MAKQLPPSGVSIIIPAFDDRPALRRLLTELRRLLTEQRRLLTEQRRLPADLGEQSAEQELGSAPPRVQQPPWELIVVEGSKPAGVGAEPVESDRALADLWLHCEANRARQLQLGADNAGFSQLWFLHADTSSVAEPLRWLNQQLEQATAAECAKFWGRFDVRLDSPRLALRVVGNMMNWRSRWSGICTGDQGMFVSRALLADIGGWPDQPLMEDVELSRRLKSISRPKTPRATLLTSARRWHKNGVVRTIFLMWRLRLQYFFGASPARLQTLYNPTVARPQESDGSGTPGSSGATRVSQ